MKKILAIFMAIVVLATFAFFAVGSFGGKENSNEIENGLDATEDVYYEDDTYYEDEFTTSVPETETIDDTYSSYPVIYSATTLNGSVLSSSNINSTRTFVADNAFDDDYDTCWCVNTSNNAGVGAEIRFDLTEKSLVSGFKMVNGNLYLPETDIYKSNGQVKEFTLTFNDGTSKSFIAEYNDDASTEYEYFYFTTPVVTDYITLTVDSGYIGQKYTENVAISEVDVF